MQQKEKAGLPASTSSKCAPFEKVGRRGWLHSSDAGKTKQLHSPVTMSPAAAGSGNGEGPRETAGRSNLPTQARGRTQERRKAWRWGWGGKQRKELALHQQKIQREKAARRRIHDLTSGSHAQFSKHNERQNGDM